MKKVYCILFFALLLGLAACSGEGTNINPAADSTRVVEVEGSQPELTEDEPQQAADSATVQFRAEVEEAIATETPHLADEVVEAESAAAAEPTDVAEEETVASLESVVVRIGRTGSPDTLNPGVTTSILANSIIALVYDSMYQLELDGTYSLELAEQVDVSDDGLVYTFMLYENVTFHDGEPLTAADVAFSYNLYATQEEFPLLPSYTESFASVEAPDERTVVITLTEPIPNIEAQLINMWVLPQHIWGELDETAVLEFDNATMIGSGPFQLLEHEPGNFIRLGAVKAHFLQSATVDEVIFQTFERGEVLVEALRIGEVDMITELPNTAVAGLREESDIALAIGPPLEPTVRDIILNQIAPESCPTDEGGICSGHPALRDRNVRLALSHAINKQQIIDDILLGLGTPGRTLIPDGLGVYYNDALEEYAFDPSLANQILDDAGYLDSDGDGIREMPDGSMPLIFRVNWDQDELDSPDLAEMVSSMWADVGVGTELQGLDFDSLLGVCCPTFDFDVIVWSWFSDPDPNFLLSVMLSSEIPFGFNETGYANPDYDDLYAQQAAALDTDARIELVHEMQRIIHEDVNYIIPYYPQTVQAFRTDRFTGWQTDAGTVALESIHSLRLIEPIE